MLERRKGLDVPPGVPTVRDRIAFRRKSDDLSAMLFRLNHWWEAICVQHGLRPKSGLWQDFAYHVAELVKNGLICADEVEVFAIIKPGVVGVVVRDNGPGMEDPQASAEISIGGGYGLQETIHFADSLVIETRRRRFEKRRSEDRLIPSGPTSIITGTRIAMFKKRRTNHSAED
jgi:anti-sigma regulatory factor (Ser/Thr protein kinase)